MWRDPGGSWACLPPGYDYHTATCCHICRTCPKKQCAEHVPKRSWEKRRVPQNAEKKLVLGFLHSINRTGSPQDESYIHIYYISGENNKSSKRKFKKKKQHNAINSKHNQHQYLHFTHLQLWKVWTGMFSFVDHFSTKLEQSNHKYLSNSLLWHNNMFRSQYLYSAGTQLYWAACDDK